MSDRHKDYVFNIYTDATVSLRLHDVAKITLYMNRRLTAENMYNVGWHEGRELYIILKPCLLTPCMISCSTSVSPCYVLRDTRLPPVFTYMYVFCACSLMCVYVYCGTAVHIHQQPFVCVCNVKRLCVYVHGRAWCIVHVNESNNWLRRFCIQGMWGTILGFFKCLIVLKLKKKITHV